MIDIFNLPNTAENTQIFYSDGTTSTWQTWRKPRNAKFVHILCIGGGGGGGGGRAGAGLARTGGGGGGSSGLTRAFFQANFIPDTLYINVGAGGAGGGSGSNGTGGGTSYVSIVSNSTAAINVLLTQPGANGGLAAGTGGGSAAGGKGSFWVLVEVLMVSHLF